jgi:hypothetical protein
MLRNLSLTTAALGLSLASCATVSIQPTQLESNEASIQSAVELGALNVPAARLHVELAKDETQNAKQLSLAGDARAPIMLARAQADAELALALARAATVHTEALRAADDLKAVQSRGAP